MTHPVIAEPEISHSRWPVPRSLISIKPNPLESLFVHSFFSFPFHWYRSPIYGADDSSFCRSSWRSNGFYLNFLLQYKYIYIFFSTPKLHLIEIFARLIAQFICWIIFLGGYSPYRTREVWDNDTTDVALENHEPGNVSLPLQMLSTHVFMPSIQSLSQLQMA